MRLEIITVYLVMRTVAVLFDFLLLVYCAARGIKRTAAHLKCR